MPTPTWPAGVARAVRGALVTAPGRPEGQRELSPRRFRVWRTVVVVQACLAVGLCVVYLNRGPWPIGGGLALLAVSVPLAQIGLGRPLPAWRFALCAAAVGSFDVWGWALPPLAVACLLFAPAGYLYLVGVAYDRRVLFGAWLATMVLLAAVAGQLAVIQLLLTTGAALLSYNTRARRLAGKALAEQMRRSAEERAARALLEERSRIARELHDVVAHHMSVIAIHAETAPYRVPEPPAPLVESFAVIRSSALEALTELRRLLTILRSHDLAAETAPQPGLAQLDDLVATARMSGLIIQAHVVGSPRPLPPGVDLSAFRIVQEGLSNALRHAPGSTMTVHIEYAPDQLRLTIHNSRPPGRTTADVGGRVGTASGHGLLGMRERVAMLGGALTTAPTPEGGFLVQAILPFGTVPVDAPSDPAVGGPPNLDG